MWTEDEDEDEDEEEEEEEEDSFLDFPFYVIPKP